MEELDARSINITGLFATLQMCHENSAKMAGHLVQLGSTLTPKQYTYIMKHSLHPLVPKNIKESTSTISEQFQVTPKKLYEGLTGKRYDPGQKLTKVEKAA